MAEFLRIKGWAKYQHYKDRNPPWIKLHRELLTSLTWAMADDASRVLAIACMMLAAATDNKIPFDPAYVKRVAYLNGDPDFSQLLKLEFLEVIDDKGQVVLTAITPLADASKMQAHARPETETETEQRKKKPSPLKPAEVLPVDSRHIKIKSLICNAYEQENGVQCPWDGSEGKQLKAFLDATPRWVDSQVAQCLVHMYGSAGFAKGTRPREFLPRLPKYLNGPLNEFNREQSNGSGNSKGDRRAADISKTTRAVFGGSRGLPGNDPAGLPLKAAAARVGAVAGNSQGLLVSGIQSGDDPPDKQPAKV